MSDNDIKQQLAAVAAVHGVILIEVTPNVFAITMCEHVDYTWGPHDGCREFMDALEEWPCQSPATHVITYHDDSGMPDPDDESPTVGVQACCLVHAAAWAEAVDREQLPEWITDVEFFVLQPGGDLAPVEILYELVEQARQQAQA
jgi:hypothetical protein